MFRSEFEVDGLNENLETWMTLVNNGKTQTEM